MKSNKENWQSYKNASLNPKVRKSVILRKKRIAKEILPTDNVLDVGSGRTRMILEYITLNDDSQYYPVDINQFFPETIVVDITKEKLPFSNNFFDKIIFSSVLEHLDNPIFTLKEVRRVLNTDGSLIITVPNCENFVKIIASIISEKRYIKANNPEHCLGFGTEEICNLLMRASLKVTNFEKYLPEIATINLVFPNWRIFKPMTSEIFIIAKKENDR